MQSSWSNGSVKFMVLASFCGGVLFTMYYWRPSISLPRFDAFDIVSPPAMDRYYGNPSKSLWPSGSSLELPADYVAKCAAPRNEIEIPAPKDVFDSGGGNVTEERFVKEAPIRKMIKIDSNVSSSSSSGSGNSSSEVEQQELPARECNYGYIVAKDDIFRGEIGVPQLPLVKDVEDAVEQIRMCANLTGVDQYFNGSSNPNSIRTTAVFILTNWRSGSTFFGEVLSAHPAFFYYFEPMMYTVDQQYYLDSSLNGSESYNYNLGLISDLFNCASKNDSMFTRELRKKWNTNDMNNKIRRQCLQLGSRCPDPEFMNPACHAFPIKLFKLTRLRGYSGEKLLKLFPGSKLIYLLRDPRGIYASRNEMKWCQPDTSCGSVEAMCCSLNLDLEPIRHIQQKYRNDVQVIKYEHLAMNPIGTLRHIFENLRIPWHPNVDQYLGLHTGKENANSTMSTVRKSSSHINRWIGTLNLKIVDEIQRECQPYMKTFDYNFLHVPEALVPEVNEA